MKLRPDTLAMTTVLALLAALGPLSTDLYLPSLPSIARYFSVDTAATQFTLSIFLFGFAVGQIFYGPLSDRHGRRPVLLGGLALFLIASILCANATSIEILIGARFLQALGGSGPIVLARAMVRDLYEGPRAGRELARIGMIMGLVPAAAPIVGSVIETYSTWRMSFWVCVLFSLSLGLVVYFRMPETIRQRSPDPVSIPGYIRSFGKLVVVPSYLVYVGLVSLAYAGLFCFISGSSFLLQGDYGQSPIAFAASFCTVVIGFIAGTIAAQKMVRGLGLDGVIAYGVACLAAGGVLMTILVLLGTGSALEISLPMALYAFGVGLTMPQGQASALMPFPERAGAAASLLGLTQMTLAGVVGVVVGHSVRLGRLPLPLTIAVIGLVAFALFHLSKEVRARGRA